MLSLDDLELTGEEKIEAEQHFKKWLIEQKEIEEKREKEQAEKSSRDFNRQSQQLHFYSEMRIAEQVEAMRRFKTKPSIEQTKPTKKPINEQRDDDFKQWENEEKPDLESMTKDQVQGELIKREKLIKENSHLWGSGFDGWWKEKNKTNWWKENSIIIGCKAGRPKKQ
jgi:hypothetical protein